LGIGIKKMFGRFAPRDPVADYEQAKSEVTRRISGGGMTRDDLDNMSHEADRSMEHIKSRMRRER